MQTSHAAHWELSWQTGNWKKAPRPAIYMQQLRLQFACNRFAVLQLYTFWLLYKNQAKWILRHFKYDPGSNQPGFTDMMLGRTGCSRCHSSWGEGMLFIQRVALWIGRVLVIISDRVFYIVEVLGRLQFKGTKNVSDILLSLNTICLKFKTFPFNAFRHGAFKVNQSGQSSNLPK